MSASLVGSEMCIRDRGQASRHPEGSLSTPGGACTMQWRFLWVSRCIGAVSYTHLTLPTICSV
eukprot:14210619-Alexandrium_andersonii.AAC.1